MEIITSIFQALKSAEIVVSLLEKFGIQQRPMPVTPGERMLALFDAAGAKPADIPDLLPDAGLTIGDCLDSKKLDDRITSSVVTSVSMLFDVNGDWVAGHDTHLHDVPFCYKSLDRFIVFIHKIRDRIPDHLRSYSECLFIKPCGFSLEELENNPKEFSVVIREPMQVIGEQVMYRYHPIPDQLHWEYEYSRRHLHAMALIAFQFRMSVRGVDLDSIAIQEIHQNTYPVGAILKKVSGLTWYPDDYIYQEGESACCRHEQDALRMRSWLQENGWMDLLLEKTGGRLHTPWNKVAGEELETTEGDYR